MKEEKCLVLTSDAAYILIPFEEIQSMEKSCIEKIKAIGGYILRKELAARGVQILSFKSTSYSGTFKNQESYFLILKVICLEKQQLVFAGMLVHCTTGNSQHFMIF